MLANETEFPQQGSRGYLVGTGQEARIIQRRGDGRLLVSISEKLVRTVSTPFKRIPASSRTILPEEIKATLEEACPARPARKLGQPVPARAGAV